MTVLKQTATTYAASLSGLLQAHANPFDPHDGETPRDAAERFVRHRKIIESHS